MASDAVGAIGIADGAPRQSLTAYRVLLALLAIAAGAAAIAFTWQPDIASFFDDSVAYLLMAQAASPFTSALPVVVEAARREEYPPLFPWLLAVTNGAFDWRVAHAVVAACFGASVFLLGVYTRAVSGSTWLAIAAAIVYAVLPGSWLNVKGILSEFPYLALSFAALAYHLHRHDETLDIKSSVVLGVLLTAVLLTRSIGITLVAAVAVAEGVRFLRSKQTERLRGAAIAIALPLLAGALWYAVRPTGGEDLYRVAWTYGYMVVNASVLADAWFNALLIYWQEWWRPAFLGASLIGLAGMTTAIVRAWRGGSDGLYCLFFIVLLLFWPFPGQLYRIAFPVVPILIVLAFVGLRELLARAVGPFVSERWAAAAVVLPLALCVPPLFHLVGRASVSQPVGERRALGDIAEFYRLPDLRVATTSAAIQIWALQDMERIRASTSDTSRVMHVMPGYVALLAQRRGVLHDRSPSAEPVWKQALRTQADYIYLSNVHPHDSALRRGNPVEDWSKLREFTDLVWQRAGPAGDVHAVLLKVDRAKAEKLGERP